MSEHKTLFRLLGTVFVVSLSLGVLLPAYGLVGSISIVPADNEHGSKRNVFVHTIREGEVIEDSVAVTNRTTNSLKVFIFSGGQEVVNGELVEADVVGDRIDEPGTWLVFPQQEIVLSPAERRVVDFEIHVPDKVNVGEHQTILYVQSVESSGAAQKTSGLNINIRNGVTIYMTVPGEIDRTLVIDRISHSIRPFWKLFTKEMYFTIDFKNEGNITLRPLADIKVQGLFGHAGEEKDVKIAKIRRGDTARGEKKWIKRAPYFGRFVATFDFHLGETEQVNEDGSTTLLPDEIVKARYVFWIFPWIETIYLIILLFLLYLLRSLWLYVVIINRLKTKTEVYTVAKGDSLTTIGSKLGISPRILVKFNLIPWPYEVHPGDKLLVPVGKFTGGEWHGRVSDMVRDKNIWKGVWGHLFRRRNVHKLTHKHVQPTGKSAQAPKTVVAEAGDTVEDVAKFLGVDKQDIIEANDLRPPYRLKAGQELKVPAVSSKKPTKATRRRKK